MIGRVKNTEELNDSQNSIDIWMSKSAEIIIDFLYKFKDKLPNGKLELKWSIDLFDEIMEFMRENKFKPSKSLQAQYECSKTTTNLKFPEYHILKEKLKMSKKDYGKIKKRIESKPPFVYFFDPDLKVKTKDRVNDDKDIEVVTGYFKKMKRNEDQYNSSANVILSHRYSNTFI